MPHNRAADGSTREELTQEEVFRLLEQTASEDHPNPDRLGCPPTEMLTAFACNPREFAIQDPIFEHLSDCSPCFRFVKTRRG
jgi:hypothetical protein